MLYAKNAAAIHRDQLHTSAIILFDTYNTLQHRDTTATKGKQKQTDEEKKKVKEVAKAKKQPKPEKIENVEAAKQKPKRQRRPEGLERPPEIPRRND